MQDHPALKFKYDIVQYTRGNGIELGGGQLYPHFKAPFDGMEGLDFVFAPNIDGKPGEWFELIKVGGHLVLIIESEARGLANVAAMEQVGSWDLKVNEVRSDKTKYSFLQVFEKLSEITQ